MSKQKINYRFLGGMAVAFVLPLSFYMIARLLSKDKIHLPPRYFAVGTTTRQVRGSEVVDTIYHELADIALVNQLGKNVSLNSTLQGKILVINFFFTTCATACPRITSNIALLQKAFRKNPKIENGLDNSVQFVSITTDPQRDSVAALRAYADAHGANHDHWWFLTGDKQTIYDYAKDELHLFTGPGDGGAEDFVHSEKLVLIDAQRVIRGYYDGLDPVQVKKCADDIVLLTLEKEKPHTRGIYKTK